MQDSLERGQKQVKQVKLRQGLQIEDKQFQQMINDSGVGCTDVTSGDG
jgi:rapamycin-insensitive companion of mTOR